MQPSHSGPNIALRPISQSEWLEMMSRHIAPEQEPAIRRGDQRYNVDGMVTLALINADRHGLQTAVRTMPLIQVSESGVMVRSPSRLGEDTVVGMQAYLGDDTFALLGRVMHCTETIGGYKVGIQLAFMEADGA